MKFFLDTADINEIKGLVNTGFVDGITTNPTLIAKSGRKILDVIAEICDIVPGPVSAEVAATDYETMIKEGEKLASIAKHVVIKVPLTQDGLLACRYFANREIKVNVTLCFSAMQAMLAAKAGASYISPFVGRIDDTGHNGMQLIADIKTIYNNYGVETEILAASIRHSVHVLECALIGADIATVPPSILKQLIQHPLTDKGVAAFVKDWQATNDSILG